VDVVPSCDSQLGIQIPLHQKPSKKNRLFRPADRLFATSIHGRMTTTREDGAAGTGTNGDASNLFSVSIVGLVALVEFSKGNHQNAFSQVKMRALEALVKKLDADNGVRCIVLSGGRGRSFGAGGDFNETTLFTGGDEVDVWLENVTNLYTTIAGISKPVIAAIDGYAVGLGLQIALCCDYRIGSESCHLMMPELRMGISCNFGGFMLEAVVGRPTMQKMIFTAEGWDAKTALKDHLLHEVVPSNALHSRALERARTICSWPSEAVRETRPHINAGFIAGVRALGDVAKRSHRAAFAAGHAQVNMKQIITKNRQQVLPWIMLTNAPVPSLARALRVVKDTGVYVYGQGATLGGPNFCWLDESPSPNQVSEWVTSLEARGSAVHIRTGALNTPPLYTLRNTTTRTWAVGTDPFTLNIARSQWGMPVGFADPTVIHRDETTSFFGISQLPSCSSYTFQNIDSMWTFSSSTSADPVVVAALHPRTDDFASAGLAFVTSLQSAIAELTRDGPVQIATLLSGGIDSGAVTAFAALAGLEVTAYSAGSPWGNEHAEAAELADFLGVKHVRVDFTAEELLAAAPESMRALGTAEQERVDIALTITALLRSGTIKETHVLTGYGNDLLNLGLPPSDASNTDILIQEIIDGVDITRHSGEFTDSVAQLYGKRLSHPYWHPDVVRKALDVHPSLKVRDGREKAYFRAAMEPFVPASTAWRKKIGIHLGGGLQGGLDAAFGGRENKAAAYREAFESVTARLLQDPFANIRDLVPSLPPRAKEGGSLTQAGAGLVLDGAGVSAADASSLQTLAQTILSSVSDARFVLVKNLTLSEGAFKSIVRALGEPVIHKFQTGGSDLMKLPATHDKGNVVLGRGMLPAHTDGLFVGHRPDLLMLYASEFSDLAGSGETTIIDQVAAMEEMPESLRNTLEGVEFEYQIVETGHHMKSLGDMWFSVPPVTEHRGRKCLGVSLPFPPTTDKSWNIRVKGWGEAKSTALLGELDQYLYQERYLYQHPWQVGDLLIIDNFGTLHGRTAISERGVRCLYRGQVNRRALAAVATT
jgi:carboxymethylproline synthase